VSGQQQAVTALTLGNSPRHPLERRLCGPKHGLDTVKERKFSCPDWNRSLIPRLTILVAMLTQLSGLRGKRNKNGNYNQSQFFYISPTECVYLLQRNRKYLRRSSIGNETVKFQKRLYPNPTYLSIPKMSIPAYKTTPRHSQKTTI
jgi:hypothetical protein